MEVVDKMFVQWDFPVLLLAFLCIASVVLAYSAFYVKVFCSLLC
jgi:hypothetical protein